MEKNKIGIALVICILCFSMFSTLVPLAQAAKPPPTNPSIVVEKYVWDGST